MSPSISTTVKQIWKKLTEKEYRDSFVSAHISNTISSQIFSLREQRGWTQKDLAKQAGMAQSRISSLEDPNLENIEISTLKRLASAFDVALTVRFVPFSELTSWTASLSTEKLIVPDFAADSMPIKMSNDERPVNLQSTGQVFRFVHGTTLAEYLGMGNQSLVKNFACSWSNSGTERDVTLRIPSKSQEIRGFTSTTSGAALLPKAGA